VSLDRYDLGGAPIDSQSIPGSGRIGGEFSDSHAVGLDVSLQ